MKKKQNSKFMVVIQEKGRVCVERERRLGDAGKEYHH